MKAEIGADMSECSHWPSWPIRLVVLVERWFWIPTPAQGVHSIAHKKAHLAYCLSPLLIAFHSINPSTGFFFFFLLILLIFCHVQKCFIEHVEPLKPCLQKLMGWLHTCFARLATSLWIGCSMDHSKSLLCSIATDTSDNRLSRLKLLTKPQTPLDSLAAQLPGSAP